ncbi:hypothetical protein [Lachnoanaerobaculum sp. OBRC5-5]|uniref:hypothetical protein n=1 Tax=Lachnoanaerobaculum sp. OBRC5-5 TaxID=936595 RepID=UPI0002824D56|nr:hypothetical protein [Lachnoanaerobaculum sp. OBRC5-5]EJZ68896.1 YhgE/Pip domain-containing protein [Lachnoanaerobaculum sp. OBRC5-5]
MGRILKSTKLMAVALSVCMLCSGIVLGSIANTEIPQNISTANNYQIIESDKSYKVVSTKDIAVVNLDDGVKLKGKKAYYAGKIITLPNEHFYMTGLDDARNGLKSGKYGAYIVIPATFSKAIESINSDPQKATINYTVNADNNDASLASIVNDINSFASVVSENITFIYVSAILDEYHRAQDNTKVILRNDSIDLDNINSISPESLLGRYENIKENNIDFKPSDIDLDKYNVENENIVDSFSRELREAKEENERNFDNIKREGEEVRTGTDSFGRFFESLTPLRDNSGNSVYSHGLTNIERLLSGHNDRLNSSFNMFDEIFKRQNEQTKNTLQEEANVHLASESNALRSRINLEISSIIENSYRRIFEQEYQNIQRSGMELMRRYIENVIMHELVMDTEESEYLLSKLATASDAIMRENINTATMSNAINSMTDNIVPTFNITMNPFIGSNTYLTGLNTAAETDFNTIKTTLNFPIEELNDAFRNDIEDVIDNSVSNMSAEINEKIRDFNDVQRRYIDLLDDYNPYTHLNDSYMSRAANELERSTGMVLSEFRDKQTDDEKKVYDIMRVSDENIRMYDESIGKAYDTTMKNVIDVVNELRSKKESTKSENRELMNDFSDKLSYTRLGSIGNKDAYNFISSPVEIAPNDDSNIEVKSDYMYNPGTKKSNMMDNRYLKGAISVGGISFILLVAMVLNALFNKTEKED